MPNTYSQIYIHYVFAVHSRDASIDVQWRELLYQYIGGIVRKRKQQNPPLYEEYPYGRGGEIKKQPHSLWPAPPEKIPE